MKGLLTGSNGFLGKNIIKYFLYQNTEIDTIGRQKNDSYFADFLKEVPFIDVMYDIVIHAAGKAHLIPKNKFEEDLFNKVNFLGTKKLLLALDNNKPKFFVYISSVAVYGLNSGKNISEEHPLNANDPYGLSKIQAESIVQEWCTKNNVICTILRLPLLVGENPPGNLGAMIKGIIKGYYFNIAGGLAKKSMVMAEDVVQAILPASKIGGIYHLTDGYHPSFKELSFHIANQLQKKTPKNIPTFIANFLGQIGDLLGKKAPFSSYKLSKITSDLTFDDSKARNAFGWSPNKVLDVFEINGSL
jgi:nucleoside-diphosphate-sugar epimerase